jgi:hypothetical protein
VLSGVRWHDATFLRNEDRPVRGAYRIRQQESYGILCNPKVWAMQEFKNSSDNHLGMPLPKGRVRFHRRDDDGQLEFTGENNIDHTPKDETIRLYTGNAFDMTGERSLAINACRASDHSQNGGLRRRRRRAQGYGMMTARER